MTSREHDARTVRARAAELRPQPYPKQTPNGEERRYRHPNGSLSYAASYSKGLPHDENGLVDGSTFRALLKAIEGGQRVAFEKLPGSGNFVDPTAGLTFELMGPDPTALAADAAPQTDSGEAAAELTELYWMALLRDVPFRAFADNARVEEAVRQLNSFYAFSGTEPIAAGRVRAVLTPGTLFRGILKGDREGPYLSQLLWPAVDDPRFAQGRVAAREREDFATDWAGWLTLQSGKISHSTGASAKARFLLTPRDLAASVAGMPRIEPFVNVGHLLQRWGLAAASSPLAATGRVAGVALFGALHLHALLAEVGTRAARAAAFQKWFVHRRLRPEALAGRVELNRRVENGQSRASPFPVHPQLLACGVLDAIARRAGNPEHNHLLPLAYEAGAPLSPSYVGATAAVAGACVTVLKAVFQSDRPLPWLVEPDATGRRLIRRANDEGLTVGGELNKLASNMAMGRAMAGVNYFSDYTEGLWVGENVAVAIMREQRLGYLDPLRFTITPFFGAEPLDL